MYILPVVEYASSVWNPYYRKDVETLEKLQRRATKLPLTTRGLPYEERLRQLSMTTLEDRRQRADQIETFKILRNIYGLQNLALIFQRSHNEHLRDHSLKIQSQRFKLGQRQFFLANRVVHLWNSLPDYVVNSKSVAAFKCNYDKLKLL